MINAAQWNGWCNNQQQHNNSSSAFIFEQINQKTLIPIHISNNKRIEWTEKDLRSTNWTICLLTFACLYVHCEYVYFCVYLSNLQTFFRGTNSIWFIHHSISTHINRGTYPNECRKMYMLCIGTFHDTKANSAREKMSTKTRREREVKQQRKIQIT